MKACAIIIALLIGIHFDGHATKFPGYIVDIEGDTIYCHFLFNETQKYKIGDEMLSPQKIRIEVDKAKLTIAPAKILSYSILLEEGWETYWSVNTVRKEYMFMKLKIKGTLNYYYGKSYDSEKKQYSEHTLLHQYRTGEKLYVVHGMSGNRQKVVQFLKDCPKVQEKVRSKVLRPENKDDLSRIIYQYNSFCG